LALAAFLGLTGFALDKAIYETLRSALHDRLQSYAYGYLAGSEVTRAKRWSPPAIAPDPRLDQPAAAPNPGSTGPSDVEGSKQDNWRSPSALDKDLPFDARLKPGQTAFDLVAGRGTPVYLFSLGITQFDAANRGSVDLTLHIAEDASTLQGQLDVFRNTLL